MEEETKNEDDYTVFVGKKPNNRYLFSVEGLSKINDKVKIKARGTLISKAADISQLALNFLKDWEIKDIQITTELMAYKPSGEELAEPTKPDERVSVIDIELGKKNV